MITSDKIREPNIFIAWCFEFMTIQKKSHILEILFASFECNLTKSNYRVGNVNLSKVIQFFLIRNLKNHKILFVKNFLNKRKMSHLGNYRQISSRIRRQDLQLPRDSQQYPTTGLRTSNFEKLQIEIFYKILEKTKESTITRKKIEHSYSEARLATPESTLCSHSF